MVRGAVAAWVDQFEALFLQLFALRVPVVVALTGGAIVGGAVLALAADERIAARSATFAFGLTEVTLGLPLPSAALEIARFSVDPRHHVDVLLRGRRFDADESLRRGLVDVLVEVTHDAGDGNAASEDVVDPVVAAAVARARTFGAGGARAVGKTKLDLRHDALTRARARAIESRRIFVESWCDPQNVQRRTTLLASLTKKP
jgi:enoyl-CoA hydratase/carnithine racemase